MSEIAVQVECPGCHLAIFPNDLIRRQRLVGAELAVDTMRAERDAALDASKTDKHMRMLSEQDNARSRLIAEEQTALAIAAADRAVRLDDTLARTRSTLAHALEGLALLQWAHTVHGAPTCPVCGGHERAVHVPDYDREPGHAHDCAIGRALAGQP